MAGARRKEVEENDEESRRGDGDSVVEGKDMELKPKHEGESNNKEEASETCGLEPVYGIDRPFFHIDLTDAVDTAVRDAKRKDSLLERASAAVAEESSSGAST